MGNKELEGVAPASQAPGHRCFAVEPASAGSSEAGTPNAWTPGPWRVDPEYPADVQVRGQELATVIYDAKIGQKYTIGGECYIPREEAIANARLIAAAPDMHAALVATKRELWFCAQQLAAHGEPGCEGDSVSRALAEADVALAKARGEQP